MRIVVACLTATMLCACGTRYQDMGFSGGVEAQRITADTYRIVARGNAYTASTAIQDYALLKAAETTKEAGGSHFLIISAADSTKVEVGQTPSTLQTNVYGRTAVSTYSPGATYTMIKPGQDAYIRVLRLTPGQPAPSGAFFADEIIQHVGSRVKKPT